MPFLSVIIPTYNSSKHLDKALQSLVEQSFDDFEVIVIDGLSTDSTHEIFSSFSRNFNHAVWISEKDGGVYDAMNKGVKASKGEWIYFLGSDDKLIDPTVLQQVHQFISNTRADVVYGDIINRTLKAPYDGVFSVHKLYWQNISHQALFFRRGVFDIVGLFLLRYRVLADWEHNLRWFLSDKIKHEHVDLIIAEYGHEGLSSKNTDPLFYRDRDWNFAFSGRRTLPLKQRAWHVLKEYRSCLRELNFSRLLIKMANTPAVIFGI